MWLKSFKTRYQRSWLFRHITWVLLIKIILLIVIWHAVVKPQKQRPSIQAVSKHVVGAASKQSTVIKQGVQP